MSIRGIKKILYSPIYFFLYTQHVDFMTAFRLWLLFIEKNSEISRNQKLVPIKVKNLPYPIFLRRNSSDINVFNQIIIKQEYDTEFPSKQVDYILDLGANIGLTSIYFANVFPQARIVAIEPEPENYKILVKNTKFYPNIITELTAVWSRKTNLIIHRELRSEWSARVFEVKKSTKDSFPAKDITTIMKDYSLPKIDILKIDIEGTEKEVFSANVIPWLKKTGMIFVELHERYAPGCTMTIMRHFKKNKYITKHENEHAIFINKKQI